MKWLWDAIASLLPSLDWKEIVTKHGPVTIVAGFCLWFLAYQVFIPMRDEHKEFVRSVVETNQQNAESFRQVVDLVRELRDDRRPASAAAPQ